MTSNLQESDAKRMLCIVHSEFNDLGRFRLLLSSAGWRIDRLNLLAGDVLPHQLDQYDALMVFGGTGSLADGLSSEMRSEFKLIEKAINLNLPIVGICLGGQILSQLYGARRSVERKSSPEIGFYPIDSTSDAPDGFWSHKVFFQWHWDTMPCPFEGTNLGYTANFDCQAFYVDNSLALQFHPDATPQTVSAWTEIGANTLRNHSSKTRLEHIHDARVHDASVQQWAEETIGLWLQKGRRGFDRE